MPEITRLVGGNDRFELDLHSANRLIGAPM